MKNLQSILISVVIIFISACRSESIISEISEFSLVKSDSLVISLPFQIQYPPINWDFFKENDTVYALMQYPERSSLVLINITKGTFKDEIMLGNLFNDPYGFWHFSYYGQDTIMLVNSSEKADFSQNTIFKFVNFRGNLICEFGTDSTMSEFPQPNKKPSSIALDGLYHMTSNFKRTELINKKIVMPISMFGGEIGDKAYRSKKNPIAIVYDGKCLRKSYSFIFNDELPLITTSYPRSWQQPTLMNIEEKIVYSFPFSHDIYEYNLISDVGKKNTNNPILLDSDLEIAHLNLNKIPYLERSNDDLNQPHYLDFFPINDNGYFVRTAFIGKKDSTYLNQSDLYTYLYNNLWIGLYNSDLQLIGENLAKDGISNISLSFPWPETVNHQTYVAASGNMARFEQKIYTINYALNDVAVTSSMISAKIIKSNPSISPSIKQFIAKYKIDPDHTVLAIPSSSCPMCRIFALDYFLNNYNLMHRDKILLIVDEQAITNEQQKRIKTLKSSYKDEIIFIIDSNTNLSELLGMPFINPQLLKFRDNQLSQRMELNPDEVYQIESLIRLFD